VRRDRPRRDEIAGRPAPLSLHVQTEQRPSRRSGTTYRGVLRWSGDSVGEPESMISRVGETGIEPARGGRPNPQRDADLQTLSGVTVPVLAGLLPLSSVQGRVPWQPGGNAWDRCTGLRQQQCGLSTPSSRAFILMAPDRTTAARLNCLHSSMRRTPERADLLDRRPRTRH
jgi:hypothetical protein